jgi:hypothetical protein
MNKALYILPFLALGSALTAGDTASIEQTPQPGTTTEQHVSAPSGEQKKLG